MDLRRSGPIIFSIFIILLILTTGAFIFALISGIEGHWTTSTIVASVLAGLAVIATLTLFGYYLGTSKTIGKAQEAFDRKLNEINDALDNAAKSIDTAHTSAADYLAQLQERAGVKLRAPFVAILSANATPAEIQHIVQANLRGNKLTDMVSTADVANEVEAEPAVTQAIDAAALEKLKESSSRAQLPAPIAPIYSALPRNAGAASQAESTYAALPAAAAATSATRSRAAAAPQADEDPVCTDPYSSAMLKRVRGCK